MRDHYRQFSHPVLELSPEAPTENLFAEMDAIADELRSDPRHIPGDDQIAFRQLQKARLPDLFQQQFLDLFALWRDHDRARQEINAAARSERFTKLCAERDALFAERASQPPEQQAAVTARIAEIGRELAEFSTPIEPPPSGQWG
jgi:hypothetical protein